MMFLLDFLGTKFEMSDSKRLVLFDSLYLAYN